MELDKIYNEECLAGMRRVISDGSVDAVICDLPYGTMKGIDEKHDWDDVIPTEKLFAEYERVLRRGGVAVLFSQEPYTSHLLTYVARNMEFCYPLIWKKDSAGNSMMAKKAPISYFEDINVFVKVADSANLYPLREYAKKVMEFTGRNGCKMEKELAAKGVDKPWELHHFIAGDAYTNIRITSEYAYNMLIDHYGIDKMPGFMTYEELKKVDADYKTRFARTFNLPHGKQSMSNILEFRKDSDGFHPTQKPVALMQTLVETYTNPGDVVLDNCMGSGTTAVACHRAGRHFIGFELNKEYFDKACERIKAEQAQLRLF